MDLSAWKIYHNSLLDWAVAGSIFVLLLFGFYAVKKLLCRALKRPASTGAQFIHLDRILGSVLDKTNILVLAIASAYLASLSLTLPRNTQAVIYSVLVISGLIQAAIWGQMLLHSFLERLISRKSNQDVSSVPAISLIGFFARVLLWILALLLILDNLGFDVTALVAGLGVGGVAVALAAQKILEDLFSSLSIVLDKPFVQGDFIVVGDMMGTVEKIGLKTTRVRSLSGELLIFSNSDLLQSRIRNYKRMYERRVEFEVKIIYETAPEKIREIPAILKDAIQSQPLTRFDRAHFKTLGDFSLDFAVAYFVLDADFNKYMDIQQAVNLKIMDEFRKRAIEFAYPTHVEYVRQGA